MSRTIFWSWQSDQDKRVSRDLIREALVTALQQLNGDVVDAERLEIDHDTRGVAGSPDIVPTILAKIDAADVFVADITPIAISENGKHVANPNVLIELGYAKKSLGPERWLTVWNTAFTDCKAEDLPFDLRGKRGPIAYSLKSGASKEELKQAREELVGQFVQRIRPCLDAIPIAPAEPLAWQPSVEGDPSLWVAAEQPFPVNASGSSVTKEFENSPRWYARILPSKFSPASLDKGQCAYPVIKSGYSWGNVKGGVITYSGGLLEKKLYDAAMWFRNTGEVWATHIWTLGRPEADKHFNEEYVIVEWAKYLKYGLSKLSKDGGIGPFHIRLGVAWLEGVTSDYGNRQGRGLEPAMEFEFTLDDIGVESWKPHFVRAWTDLRRIFSFPPPNDDEVNEIINVI